MEEGIISSVWSSCVALPQGQEEEQQQGRQAGGEESRLGEELEGRGGTTRAGDYPTPGEQRQVKYLLQISVPHHNLRLHWERRRWGREG